ncbi:hypothetical protein [Neobacillus driksii]|jgi:hypothetical protein|nr:hypothetical protein [Neobacillus niacini]
MYAGSFSCPHPLYEPSPSYVDRVEYEEEDDFVIDNNVPLSDEQ